MNFLTEKIGDETIVLDLDTSRCHCLKDTSSFIWEHVRSNGSDEGLEVLLQEHFQLSPEEASACLQQTLQQLTESQLIDPEQLQLSRRKALQWLGGSLLVTTLLPTPAAAASCTLTIVSAEYGATSIAPSTKTFCGTTVGNDPSGDQFFDRTTAVRGFVSGCSISGVNANNTTLAPDPLAGTFKELRVTYSCNGGANQNVRICENTNINISC